MKNLKIWKSLSNEFNFNIIFMLQPYYKWSKNFSSEEKDIFYRWRIKLKHMRF